MILHVDMDAFYASIEERDNPRLVGKPVIVGGTPAGRGVVSAANYVARSCGVHSALPAITAHRLCPQGIFLPVRMDYYAQVARQIRQIFHRYTPLVEPLSLDEAFLDVAPSQQLYGPAEQIGKQIKQAIRDELQLVASVGVAPVKFVTKIASDLQKPDGFVVVREGHVQSFLDPLRIERLWGVGRRATETLHQLGIHTIQQLRECPLEKLTQRLGKSGHHLHQLAHGRDQRRVVPDHVARQISHETTFAQDIDDFAVLESVLMRLTEQVTRRLRRQDLRGKTVHLKVRFSDFRTITRSQTLAEPTSVTQLVWQAGQELLRRRLPARQLPIRLLGVGVSGLQSPAKTQQRLFEDLRETQQKEVDATIDKIKDRFGEQSVIRATGFRRSRRPG